MGSHHVHGTRPSLRLHYLKEVDGALKPRDHDVSTHVNQLVFTPLFVLEAVISFMKLHVHRSERCRWHVNIT